MQKKKKKRNMDGILTHPCIDEVLSFNTSFPEINLWDDLHHIHCQNKSNWNNKCYIPSRYVATYLTEKYGPNMKSSTGFSNVCYELAMVAGWRRYKQIYQFNNTLALELFQMLDEDKDVIIQSEELNNLPCPNFFVEYRFEGECRTFLGCYVFFNDEKDDPYCNTLQFVFMENKKHGDFINLSINLHNNPNVREESDRLLDMKFQAPDESSKTPAEQTKMKDESYALLLKALQLVTYLCADNRDISENVQQKKIKKKREHPKDTATEIEKWDVGYRVGNAIKKARQNPDTTTNVRNDTDFVEQSTTPHRSGFTMTPHVRRGHYKHYWYGKRGDVENRVKKRKFIAPTYVNLQNLDDLMTTIHPTGYIYNF